jgi:hypothetical protein
LSRPLRIPTDEESRYLILKIIEQAVRDFVTLRTASAPIEIEYFETACEFIFDDEYAIDYGGIDMTLKQLLGILDIDILWFRERVLRLLEEKNKTYFRPGVQADDDEGDE